MNIDDFKEHLKWAEGVRNFPYEDSVGKLTIGVGRNLDDVGLSDEEVEHLLHNDAARAISDARCFAFWDSLSDIRQFVIADLCFNLGITRFRGFVKTIAALDAGDYETAANEMEDSRWYRQTGRRARKLVRIMRSGVYDDGT